VPDRLPLGTSVVEEHESKKENKIGVIK